MRRIILLILPVSLALLATACGSSGSPSAPETTQPPITTMTFTTTASSSRMPATGDVVTFSINVQDFGHPAESAACLNRIIDLHEKYNVPVDIYLTGQMAEIFAAQFPELIGYPPFSAGALADANLENPVMRVFRELGAQFTISHGRVNNLGDEKYGLFIKPEQADYKLYEHVGQDAAQSFEEALAVAHSTKGAQAPYVVGVKMHDNNFFAAQSAWTTVYMDGGKKPDWDPSLTAPLISQADQEAMWAIYEQTVSYVASQQSRVIAVNLPMILNLLK